MKLLNQASNKKNNNYNVILSRSLYGWERVKNLHATQYCQLKANNIYQEIGT